MTFEPVRLVVVGRPAPQGSKVPFARKGKDGAWHGRMKESSATGLAVWRPRIHDAARRISKCQCPDPDCEASVPGYPIDEAVTASLVLYFERPAYHFLSPTRTRPARTILRPGADVVPLGVVGDLEKLARAVADGLQSGGLIANDKLISRYSRLERLFCGPHEQMQQAGAIVWLMPYESERLDPRYAAPAVVDAELPALF